MRLLVFVCFMGVAAVLIGVSSYLAGVGGWTIVWRVIATIVVLQVVYFLLLMLVSFLSPPKPTPAKDAPKPRVNPLTKTQKH
ncbi:hypothetical protein SLH49_21690 [Cognatiyoonia sp. IB215446]|uniref:hypothetical protein n=1 Tax=Cognatiyoonia sp. IB215446 TaxID=3097355 RepID=UPI002A158227|nr:hypothetical protein [Cognatiyoonia sp. IB215446]MDX8350611.1 hypothetical protein [Cognatiyoonia sp. IB215446]